MRGLLFIVAVWIVSINVLIAEDAVKPNYDPTYQADLEKGKVEVEMKEKRRVRFEQLRAQCKEVEINWSSATPHDKKKCLAVRQYLNDGTPITDDVLFGP